MTGVERLFLKDCEKWLSSGKSLDLLSDVMMVVTVAVNAVVTVMVQNAGIG